MKKNYTFLLLTAIIICNSITKATAQTYSCTSDPVGCSDYSNAFLNSSTAGTLEYDNIVGVLHGTCARRSDGNWEVWGEHMASDGNSSIVALQLLNAANYPGLTGTVLKCAGGSYGGTFSDQYVVLTTDGLFAWGSEGFVIDTLLTASSVFQKISVNGKADGLPTGVSPAQIKMLFGTYQSLAIVTCSGDAYVLSTSSRNMYGDGSTHSPANDTIWHHVETSVTGHPFLTNVVALRGCSSGFAALTSSDSIWTWGNSTALGDGSAINPTRAFATKMTPPVTGITTKMIGMTSDGPFSSYYLLATNGNLYTLGRNSEGQLGDFTTTDRTTWVQFQESATANDFLTNIAWVSPNETESSVPSLAAVNVLTASGTLWACGGNNAQMIGGPSGNLAINPTAMPGGLAATDKVIAVKTGGHFTMIFKQCVSNFAFVGHHVDGSAGDGTITSSISSTYNFTSAVSTFPICTETVIPALSAGTSTICQGSSVTFTPNPSGGAYSVLSANATITDSTATINNVDTVKIQYAIANGCTSTDTLYQYDYGNLSTATYPVAKASVLTSANAVWLGNTNATTDCGTNTSDGADGFSITNAITGSGTQATPWQLLGGNTYTFQVTVNGATGTAPNPVYWGVWYDVDGNGSFTDAIDQFQSGSLNHGSPASTTFSVTVPNNSGATTGAIRVAATAVNPSFTQAMNGTATLSNGEIEDYYVSYAIPLPVTLTSFAATKQKNNAFLNWQTASGQNTKSFIVERSGTNASGYTQIATVSAAGNNNTTRNYSFTDNAPANGTNYYRLKMINKDGTFTYSTVRVLNFGTATTILVYPNPTHDNITVTGLETGMQLKVMSVDGRILINKSSTNNTEGISMQNFASGMYILQVINKDGVINTVKFSKD